MNHIWKDRTLSGFTQHCWYRWMIHRFSQRNLGIFLTYVHTLQVKIKYTPQKWFLVDQILHVDIEVLWLHDTTNLCKLRHERNLPTSEKLQISHVIFFTVTLIYDWNWYVFHLIKQVYTYWMIWHRAEIVLHNWFAENNMYGLCIHTVKASLLLK